MNITDAKSLIDGGIVSTPAGTNTATKIRTILTQMLDAVSYHLGLKADLDSPEFTGTPRVPTAEPGTNDTTAASTEFVAAAVSEATVGVSSFNSRTGSVTLSGSDVSAALGYTAAPTASPAFSGNPTAPNQSDGNSSTRLATTAFVQGAISILKSTASGAADTLAKIEALLALKAPLASPTFTGVPAVPTASPGTSTTQAASTAFVAAAVSSSIVGVSSFNTRTGAVTLGSGDVTTALGYTPANAANAALTGNPTAPNQADGNNSTRIANTTFVQNAITLLKGGVSSTYDTMAKLATMKADLASPTFTGTPEAPTAAGGTNSTQIATTAFAKALADTKVASATVNGGSSFSAPSGEAIISISLTVVGGVLQLTCTTGVASGGGGGGGP